MFFEATLLEGHPMEKVYKKLAYSNKVKCEWKSDQRFSFMQINSTTSMIPE